MGILAIQKTVHLRGMTDSAGSPGVEIATKKLEQMTDGSWKLSIDASKASGFIKFLANPTAADTITLNGQVWTFVASGATGPQTDIQASLALTLVELATDLNASVDADLTPATYSAAADRLVVTHDTEGTAGNAYTLVASDLTPAGTVSGATLMGGFAGRLDSFRLGGTVQSRLFELVFATDTFGSD